MYFPIFIIFNSFLQDTYFSILNLHHLLTWLDISTCIEEEGTLRNIFWNSVILETNKPKGLLFAWNDKNYDIWIF